MNHPFDLVELTLQANGWQVKKKENFSAADYWWTWEQWTIIHQQQIRYLNFLIDPAGKKEVQNTWAISIQTKAPTNRAAAEQANNVLVINKKLAANLNAFLRRINE